MFRWSLQALACDAVDQLVLFPDGVCKDEELLDDYCHWSSVARSWHSDKFSDSRLAALKAIDDCINTICEDGSVHSKTTSCQEELSTSPEWQALRGLAKNALACFGWSVEKPPYGPWLDTKSEQGPE
jgi:hypothetical protein